MPGRKKYIRIGKIALTVVCILFLVFSIHYLTVKYGQYDYKVSENYALNVKEALVHKVSIKDGKLTVPSSIKIGNASYFLKADLKSSFTGKFREPKINISSNGEKETNTFEYGFSGTRYINLSNIIKPGETEIILKGKHCSIPDQEAEVLVCPSPLNPEKSLLVVAPHPDDAEIAAFGLYSGHPNTFILTVTMGEGGSFKYHDQYTDHTEHYMKKAELRTWNSITVPKLGAVDFDRTLNLGYFNQSLHDMYEERGNGRFESKYLKTDDLSIYHHLNASELKDSILHDPSWNGLVKNFRMVLRNIAPQTIVTPFPRLDNHKDHKVSSWALFEALRQEEMYDVDLLLYSNHQFRCSKEFPFGEMGTGTTIAPIFAEDKMEVSSMVSFELDKNKQKDKHFALEAMHDLRLGTEWLTWKGSFKIFAKQTIKSIYGYEPNYYRRSVRTNELFYVKKLEDMERL